MHSDSPLRQLDEVIRRYGVTCLKLSPYEGGGYCVELGSSAVPVVVGAGSLPEAIGKAFLELVRLKGGPSFEELLERSSLGTPHAKLLRSQADPAQVKKALGKVNRHTYDSPAVHWHRHPVRDGDAHHNLTSACGMVRMGGAHARFAKDLDGVTCGRCKNTSWYRSELWKKSHQRS